MTEEEAIKFVKDNSYYGDESYKQMAIEDVIFLVKEIFKNKTDRKDI